MSFLTAKQYERVVLSELLNFPTSQSFVITQAVNKVPKNNHCAIRDAATR